MTHSLYRGAGESSGPRWNDRAHLHLVQFEYEDKPAERDVRMCASVARIGDPIRVTVAGEVEGRIMEVAGSVLHVRIGRKLF
jgi:hypothetical protein